MPRRSLAAVPADDPRRSVCLLLIGSFAMLEGDFDQARAELSEAETKAAGRIDTAYVLALAQQALMMLESEQWTPRRRWSSVRVRPSGPPASRNTRWKRSQSPSSLDARAPR